MNELADRIAGAYADAHNVRNPTLRKVALRTVGMASLAAQAGDEESAEEDLRAASLVIGGDNQIATKTQPATERAIAQGDDTMTAKTQPANPVVTADRIAAMIADAVAQALAAQAPAPAATPKPISKNAIPEVATGSVKAIACDATVLRATASTVVYAVANHNVLWADRGISIDRMALAKLGNPATVRITITAA
jgi:hypothetical protein